MLDLGYTEDDINLNGYRVTTSINKQAQDPATAAVEQYGPDPQHRGSADRFASPAGHRRSWRCTRARTTRSNQPNDATQATALAGSTFALLP